MPECPSGHGSDGSGQLLPAIRRGNQVRLIVKKLQKVQKTLQKTLPTVYSRIYRIFETGPEGPELED